MGEPRDGTSGPRQAIFYVLLASSVADVYASKAAVLEHLTLWSWYLHLIYFQLHLSSSPGISKALHGPSFTGAHALFFMYCWTMLVNPNMEFDLAPEGRKPWLVYARAFFMHFAPVIFHWIDIIISRPLLVEIYESSSFLPRDCFLFKFWACCGGYFAMGLSWEQFNGDAAATYNIQIVSAETYVLVSKLIGVAACLAMYFLVLRPKLFKLKSE